MSRTHDLLAVLFTCALALSARSARADAASAAPDVRVADARRACAAGDVDRGVALLAEILADRNDPNAVYNQARCYQSNGRSDKALARFREFLRISPEVAPTDEQRVRRYIRELEDEQETTRTRRRATAPRSLPAADLAAKAGGGATGNGALRVLSVLSAIVCVAALGGGIYYSFETVNVQRRLEAQGQRGLVPARDFERERAAGREAEQRQWLGYGIGTAALATSMGLYLVQGRF